MLGEYTTDEGPYLDDQFIVIATAADRVFEFVVGSSQCENVVSYIREKLDDEVQLSLSNCTNCCSKILYPKELSGCEFFDFHVDARNGLLRRLSRLFRKRSLEVEVSQLVVNYLMKMQV